jgi:DNA-binding SARP family transcriptional activator
LWSEFPTANARRSLRSTLFQLRHALEKQNLSHVLVTTGDLLYLLLAEVFCDVNDYTQLFTVGDAAALNQSLSLYRGPFLQGFTLPNAPLFDEWVRQEDEKLSQGYITALQQLADDAAAHEQVDQAIHYLHQLLQADPLAETAQQQLLRLYLKTGTFNQAIRQYHQFAYDLRTRIGLTPAPETRALFHEALHRQQTPLPTKTTTLSEMKVRPHTTIQAATYFEQGEVALISNDYVAATAAAEAGLALCASLTESPAFNNHAGWGYRLLGHALAMEGSDLPSAERHLQQAAAMHRQAQNPRDLCAGLFELGNVAAQRGELLRALEFYEEATQVAEAGQAHYFHALARNNMAYHSLLLGWLKVAQRALASGQRLAETHELLGALLHLSSTQGEIYLYQAEWLAAQGTFQQGLNLAEVMSNSERQAGYRAGLALAARGQQNLSQAISLFEEALWLINGRGYWHLRTRLLIWLAETLLWAERGAEARPHLESALIIAQTQGRALLHLLNPGLPNPWPRQQPLTCR